MQKNEQKTFLNCQVPIQLARRVHVAAAVKGQSKSRFIRDALKAHLSTCAQITISAVQGEQAARAADNG